MKNIFNNKDINKIWFQKEFISSCESNNHSVKVIEEKDFTAIEYKIKLNIFSFGNLNLKLPFTVIAPPASIDKTGYLGDINALIKYYKKAKGLFLILNLKELNLEEIYEKNLVGIGKTLPSIIFKNKFSTFDDYLNNMRSSYKKRALKALKKGQNLSLKSIQSSQFTEEMYELYLEVLNKSKFPLETLPIKFFTNENMKIEVFYLEKTPVAFYMVYENNKDLDFIFGGMNYSKRDEYDLYYNMLLQIIKKGIEEGYNQINLGQTAESAKCRLGGILESRYMLYFSSNKIFNYFICKNSFLFNNNINYIKHKVFKN